MATLRDGSLTLNEGDHIRFPVEEDSPLSGAQQLRQIRTIRDVEAFQFVQDFMQGIDLSEPPPDRRGIRDGLPDLPRPRGHEARLFRGNRPSERDFLALIRAQAGGVVLSIDVADLIIPPGSSILLNQPFNEVIADLVVVGGQLRFTDDLVIRCNEIRGV